MSAQGGVARQAFEQNRLRELETGSTQNGYLLTQIAGRYESGESVESFFQIGDSYRALTPQSIQAAARAYLDTARYVRVTLLPER